MQRLVVAGVSVALAMALGLGSANAADKKVLAFVVNGASDFWKIAEAGVKKAQGELPNYNLQFKYPEQAAAAVQQRVLDDLVAAGAAGIMVSAVDPKNQTEQLNKVASQTVLFTTDSDAPQSKRVAYIGSSKVDLVDVRGDEIDQTRAKRNVEDILAAMPDVSCLVGFYSYNTPRIYEVLKEAGKLDKIKIIGFDEDPITLGGVKEGKIVGTVVQQPFEWGYQGMKLMAKYLEGGKSGIPANGIIIVPGKVIDQSNVDDFMASMKKMMGK